MGGRGCGGAAARPWNSHPGVVTHRPEARSPAEGVTSNEETSIHGPTGPTGNGPRDIRDRRIRGVAELVPVRGRSLDINRTTRDVTRVTPANPAYVSEGGKGLLPRREPQKKQETGDEGIEKN